MYDSFINYQVSLLPKMVDIILITLNATVCNFASQNKKNRTFSDCMNFLKTWDCM